MTRRLLSLAPLLLLLAACGHVDLSVTDQPRIYQDAPLERSPLSISVQPAGPTHQRLKALMLPFWVQQTTYDGPSIGRAFAQVVADTWARERLFPALSYRSDLAYHSEQQSVAMARSMGADVVITGIVPHFYDGGSLDDSTITLRVNIRETKTGQTLFTMQQAARVEAKFVEDWILWSARTRLPGSPLPAMLDAIAMDMAVPLASWLPRADVPFASTSAEMVSGLTTRPPQRDTDQTTGYDPRPSINLKVHFDFDKYVIRKESYPLLDDLGRALNSPQLKGKRVIVVGHTDSDGPDRYNITLSKNRANSVKEYLVKKCGIPSSLLFMEWYGESRPLVPNTSADNKQLNRRVEIRMAE